MSICRCAILVLVLIGLPMFAVGQNPPAQNPGDGSSATRSVPAAALSGIVGVDAQSEGETSEDLPQIPAMLGGRGSSLAFRSEMERSNYLRGGLNVGAAYDDNALLGSGGQVGNTTFSVFPSIAIDQSTSRMRWSLGYGGGLTVNQRLSSRNQGSHSLNFDSEFRVSPHVNLRVAEDFFLTAGIFGEPGGAGFQTGPGGANGTLITPLANQRSSATVVETNYHFALKDIVGASGSFYDLHYSEVTKGAGTLVDTRTAAGSAFWLHQIFRRDWAGISYRFQRLTFDPSGETRVHTFIVTNTLNISKAFTVSAFIGPEHSDNHGVAASGPDAGQVSNFGDWSMAGGVEGGWQKERTSVTAGYSRQVTNGSGILGAVRLQSVHGALRRELIPGWAATLGIAYGGNEPLTLASSTHAASIKTTSVGASLERNIGRSLGFQIGYYHDFQNQSGSSDINRNRFSATLSYQWAKPLGR
jgi:hypothetical protein